MIGQINNQLELIENNNSSITGSDGVNNNSFADLIKSKLEEVNDLQFKADKLNTDYILGKTDNIHRVMIAGKKAEIAVNLTLAVQNKVIDAYKEIMRIQI